MVRPRLEAALCALFSVLTVMTAIWPTWIEGITGLEPDGGSGGTEWGFVLVLGVLALGFGLLARRHYRLAAT
jgi:polyferredoxin